jgi:hypothetical protein
VSVFTNLLGQNNFISLQNTVKLSETKKSTESTTLSLIKRTNFKQDQNLIFFFSLQTKFKNFKVQSKIIFFGSIR